MSRKFHCLPNLTRSAHTDGFCGGSELIDLASVHTKFALFSLRIDISQRPRAPCR
jgi:hypothetical protein